MKKILLVHFLLLPFLLIQAYTILAGLKIYEVQQEITVPADIDPGD